MTRDEFSIFFQKLTEAFPVAGADRRARIYFDELSSLKASTFAEACRRIIRDDEKFPTIAKILKTAENIAPRRGNELVRESCTKCDGFGWVLFENYAFRGRCEHGRGLSEKIAFAPESELDKFNARNKINRENAEVYGVRQ